MYMKLERGVRITGGGSIVDDHRTLQVIKVREGSIIGNVTQIGPGGIVRGDYLDDAKARFHRVYDAIDNLADLDPLGKASLKNEVQEAYEVIKVGKKISAGR